MVRYFGQKIWTPSDTIATTKDLMFYEEVNSGKISVDEDIAEEMMIFTKTIKYLYIVKVRVGILLTFIFLCLKH